MVIICGRSTRLLDFGKRPKIARPSERFLLWVARKLIRKNIRDVGTGFRAFRKEFGVKWKMHLRPSPPGMHCFENLIDNSESDLIYSFNGSGIL